jgi:cobyrinic acid a,c-diamide synthase
MARVFPFKSKMKKTRSSLGYREAVLKENTFLGGEDTIIRGHEFHYSEIANSAEAGNRVCGGEVTSPPQLSRIYSVKDGSGNYIYDEGYRVKNTIGSYIHIHFGSDSRIADNFIDFVKEHHGTYYSCRTRQSKK